MALFTVSKPKPECSRSNSTNSQPAFFMIWPIPGVANSTMKCPSFNALLRDIAFNPDSAIISSLSDRRWRSSGRRPFTHQVQLGHRLRRHQRRARLVEAREVPGPHMRIERRAVVVDLVEHDAVALTCRLQHVEAPAARFFKARDPRVLVDQAPEVRHRARLQAEIHQDDKA